MPRLFAPLALLFGLVGPLIVASWYTLDTHRETLESSFRFEFDRMADVLADGMSDPIWNLLPESGQPLVDSMMTDPRVLGLMVTSVAQGPFLQASAEGVAPPSEAVIVLTRDVRRQGTSIGRAVITIDASGMSRALAAQRDRTIAIGAVQLLLSFAVVLFILRVFKRLENERVLRNWNEKLEREVRQRSRAEAAALEAEDRFRRLSEATMEGVFITENGEIIDVNRAGAEMLGYGGKDLIGRHAVEFAANEYRDSVAKIIAANQEGAYECELRRNDATEFPVEVNARMFEADGRRLRISCVRDITEARRARAALTESEERFRAVVDHSPNSFVLKDADDRYRIVNRRWLLWLGRAADEVLGRTTYDIFADPLADTLVAADRQVLRTKTSLQFETEIPFADGAVHTVDTTKFPVIDSSGDIIGVGTVGIDITDQRRAEEQLRHAQKLEAVGRLTGGVAHDFNNLLAVIIGNLEFVGDSLPDGERAKASLQTAIRASAKGAMLTQRLLAFSRKQALQPKVLSLNAVIDGMTDLLTSTLGETVKLAIERDAELWSCEVDPGQLESSLLNLVLNARDALPAGGSLTICTANRQLWDERSVSEFELPHGRYVELAVTDTGTGMPEEVAKRAFEPFFTTKEVGEGSGLGLSMVYGFVKQSGGGVAVETDEATGTTVRLLLPAANTAADRSADTNDDKQPTARGEIVLVVEDDPDVRVLAVRLLRSLGYRVSQAGDGPSAIAALTEAGRVDLLFSDVVLPNGMSGPDVAVEARRLWPEIKVLFMSGYADDRAFKGGAWRAGFELIHKPFAKSDLARKVREVLDG